MQYDSDYEKITLTKVHDELSRVLTAYETGETDIPIDETDLYELGVWTQNQLAGLLN